MAQLVIAAAGAAIGGATLGTGIVAFGLTGTAIGWAAGSMLGGLLQKGPNSQGPRLNDLRVTGTEYGQAHPYAAGSPRLPGQIVWASNKREIRNTQKVGKGGGGQRVTTFTYEVDLLYRLTENEIAGVSRIWSNGELVFGNGTTKAGVWNEVRIYTGAPDQMPDPTYEAAVGAGNAPAYRGGGSVLIRGLQLGQSGQIPNLTFEVGFSNLICTFQDQSQNQFEVTLSNGPPNPIFGFAGCDSEVKKFTLSGRFQENDFQRNFLRIGPDNNIVPMLGNDWFIGAWIYHDANTLGTEIGGVFSNLVNAIPINGVRLSIAFDNLLRGWVRNDGATSGPTDQFFLFSSNPVPLKQWVYVALERSGNIVRLYMDGNIVATANLPNGYIIQPNRRWCIGGDEIGLEGAFTGNIEDFIYENRAKYNGPFTPPQQKYTPNQFTQIYIPFGFNAFGQQNETTVRLTVDELMSRAGYGVDDYDVSGLAAEVKPLRAFAIGQIGNTRSSLEVLQKAWYFEASKSDKIYIRPRAVTPVATIPWNDLGAAEDIASDQEPLALQIGSDLELPAQIALSYNNMAADYNVATEHSDRLITNQLSTASVQMPLGMMPDEAKGVANALLFDQLASLTTTTIRVPLKYAYIEPGDVVNAVNFDGRTYRIRVIAKRDTLSILELECVLDDVGALDSAAITDNSYISITDPAQIAPTLFEPLDIPILRDADDNAGYYAAVASDRLSASDEWPGAVYVQAFSPGAFEQEFTTGDPCVMGEALTILPNWAGGNEFDESSTVNVEVVGELESSTRDLMLADLAVNAMLIGSEVIRFRLATLLSADGERRTYRLSGLLRGQRGTEWAIGGHVANERVILLNNALRRVPGLLTQIGLERDVKAVTLNTLLSDVADVPFTNDAIGLKPFAPANVVALADGADLRITWQRRTRLSVRYGGPVDQVIPLGEVSEQYRVRIFDGPTLVHTATVTTPEYLYTDLTADGFASGDPVTVEVAQLSAIVGAGTPTITTGTAP